MAALAFPAFSDAALVVAAFSVAALVVPSFSVLFSVVVVVLLRRMRGLFGGISQFGSVYLT